MVYMYLHKVLEGNALILEKSKLAYDDTSKNILFEIRTQFSLTSLSAVPPRGHPLGRKKSCTIRHYLKSDEKWGFGLPYGVFCRGGWYAAEETPSQAAVNVILIHSGTDFWGSC